jgi:heme-degrading monooxygenase HmoA
MAPPLPWRSFAPIDPDGEYVVTTTRLPLRQHRHIPAVMAATVRIARQLARSDGLIGYSLHAQLVRKTFWTMSVWQTADDLDRFVRSDVHRVAMGGIGPHMERPSIQTTRVRGGHLPPAWADVHRELTSDDGDLVTSRPR